MADFVFPLPPGSYTWGQPFGGSHPGLDLPAPSGTPVAAPQAGRLARSDGGGYGNSVILDTGAGFWRLAHFSRHADVPDGATVPAGTVIGYVGTTGHSTGNHLHIEWHPGGGAPVDPAPMLKAAEQLGGAGQVVTGAASSAASALPDLGAVADLAAKLTSGATWQRVLMVTAGAAMVAAGVAIVKRDTIAATGAKAGRVVAAVATDGASEAAGAAGKLAGKAAP